MSTRFKCSGCGVDACTEILAVCEKCASKIKEAAPSASDNNESDAIALCKKIIRLANGATILGYDESTIIINSAHAVLAQRAHIS